MRAKRLNARIGTTLALSAALLVSSTLVYQNRIAAAAGNSVVMVVAGDISCSPSDPNFGGANTVACQDQATATLVHNIAPSYLLPGGDTQYLPSAGYSEGQQPGPSDYLNGYGASWGQLQNPSSPLYVAGLVVRPTPGDHEYGDALENDRGLSLSTASNYYSYFGAGGLNDLPVGVTNASNDFYSFNIPVGSTTWHVVSLDSECAALPGPGGTSPSGSNAGCAVGSPEETFLQNDLSTHQGDCTIIHWHEPVNSTLFGYDADYQAFWNDAAKYHVTLIINGHDHDYERWVPMDANENPTPTGVTQIIAGTGGNSLYRGTFTNSNIAFNDFSDFGVLKLTLNPTTVDFAFKTVSGTTPDSGTLRCQGFLAPKVTSVSPSSGPSTGATSVTITGTNLANASAVRFGGVGAAVTADSATSLTATAPSGTGTVDVTVTTPGGTSATSSSDRFTYVAAPTVPSPPTHVALSVGDGTVKVSWSPPTTSGGIPLNGYTVIASPAAGVSIVDHLAPSATSVVLTNLVLGVKYRVTVRARNTLGESASSIPLQVTPLRNGGLANAPRNLKVIARGMKTILSWSPPSNNGGFAVIGYLVGESPTISASGGKLLDANVVPVSKRTFVLNYLPKGFRGYFFVAAMNAKGVGTRQWHRFINGGVPFAPRNLVVTSQGQNTILTWNPPSNDGGFVITGYQVREVTTQAALKSGGRILNRLPLPATSRTFKIANLDANFKGYVVVYALNARGPGIRVWHHFAKDSAHAISRSHSESYFMSYNGVPSSHRTSQVKVPMAIAKSTVRTEGSLPK